MYIWVVQDYEKGHRSSGKVLGPTAVYFIIWQEATIWNPCKITKLRHEGPCKWENQLTEKFADNLDWDPV